MAHLKSFRRAFTLIELLVVVTIIGILIGMMIPAVNTVREAARKIECTNNVKQLVLAMNNYHAQLNYFPPNRCWGSSADANGSDVVGESWMVGILPFIEMRPLADTIQTGTNINYASGTVSNLAAAKRAVAAFRCPSDLGSGTLPNQVLLSGQELGVTNYKACSGANWNGTYPSNLYKYRKQDAGFGGRNADQYDGRDYGDGLMCRGYRKNIEPKLQPVSAFEISRDGLSTTFAVGECIPTYCGWSTWWWWQGTTATCAMPINFEEPPPGPPRNQNAAGSNSWQSNMGFMSRHSGSSNFGMCDGSARSISYLIDINVYRALATIDGGEILPAEF